MQILAAIDRCEKYEQYLRFEELGAMAYDAVLRNLGLVGEAVRALPPDVRAAMPDVPWASIAGLRNIVVHEYFRVNPDLVLDIVDNKLGPLVQRLRLSPGLGSTAVGAGPPDRLGEWLEARRVENMSSCRRSEG